MASIQSSLSLSFSSSASDCGSLIKWIESIPSSHLSQDYSTLAVLIQQNIEPIIREEEPQIVQGKVLSSAIAQSKGCASQPRIRALDPAFLPFLNSTAALESILVTRVVEKVNTISKVICLVCRADKDTSALELMRQGSKQELVRMQDSIQGPFNVFAQVLVSNQSPCFPHLTDFLEQSSLKSTQGIEKSFRQSEFTLKPRDGVLLERHFEHGESKKTITKLSVALKDDKIITRQTRKTSHSSFTDLIFRSDVFLRYRQSDD